MVYKLENYLNKFDKFLAGISAISLFLMMALITTNIVTRNLFNFTIKASVEFVGDYLMVIMVFFALSYTQMHRSHISVELVIGKLPKYLNKALIVLSNLIVVGFTTWIGIINFRQALQYVEKGITSSSVIHYPLAPAIFIVATGCLLLAVRFLLETVMVFVQKSKE